MVAVIFCCCCNFLLLLYNSLHSTSLFTYVFVVQYRLTGTHSKTGASTKISAFSFLSRLFPCWSLLSGGLRYLLPLCYITHLLVRTSFLLLFHFLRESSVTSLLRWRRAPKNVKCCFCSQFPNFGRSDERTLGLRLLLPVLAITAERGVSLPAAAFFFATASQATTITANYNQQQQ